MTDIDDIMDLDNNPNPPRLIPGGGKKENKNDMSSSLINNKKTAEMKPNISTLPGTKDLQKNIDKQNDFLSKPKR